MLKVLNFSGAEKSNIFKCTFTFAGAAGSPHRPTPSRNSLTPLPARPRGHPVASTRPVEPGEGEVAARMRLLLTFVRQDADQSLSGRALARVERAMRSVAASTI